MRIQTIVPFSLLVFNVMTISGCGFVVPEMQDFPQDAVDEGIFENTVVNQIKCELRKSVYDVQKLFPQNGPHPGESIDWLNNWGAKVSLRIAVDEKSTLAPGLSLNTPMANRVLTFPSGNVTIPRSFVLGLGANFSTDSTRTETIGFYYAFADLQAEAKTITAQDHEAKTLPPCSHVSNILIASDLKIEDFMVNKMLIYKHPGTVFPHVVYNKNKDVPVDVLAYEQQFVVSFGGDVTPAWKLLRVSANTSSPFFSATRMRTHDLTITMGPAVVGPITKGLEPSEAVVNAHLASMIGQEVAQHNQSLTPR
jgi:hypothetical protein